jgi:hypothetical protein
MELGDAAVCVVNIMQVRIKKKIKDDTEYTLNSYGL